MLHLLAIVGFGKQRTVGTLANEVLTADYLRGVLQGMQAATRAGVRLEVVTQRASGAFHLDFLDGMSSAYTNVTNILVRLSTSSCAVSQLRQLHMLSRHRPAKDPPLPHHCNTITAGTC